MGFFCFQEFACNGTVVEHPEYGEVIQLQGDQRNNISDFLCRVGLAGKEQIKVCNPCTFSPLIDETHNGQIALVFNFV